MGPDELIVFHYFDMFKSTQLTINLFSEIVEN